MSWMGAFIKNIHAMIFRYLMYFDAQFSCLIQFISLEYTGPCIYMITKTEFIYKDVLQVIKFINQHFNFFLLPFIIPKSSSINIFNIIGHFMFMFLHIIVNSSSNMFTIYFCFSSTLMRLKLSVKCFPPKIDDGVNIHL